MSTPAELRAEAADLRVLASRTTDETLLAEILALIDELERLARESTNGAAGSVRARRHVHQATAMW